MLNTRVVPLPLLVVADDASLHQFMITTALARSFLTAGEGAARIAKAPQRRREEAQVSRRTTPDMTGKASEITDPILLFARIGYRTYLAWRDGEKSPSKLYGGFNLAELRRVQELTEEES